MPKLVSWLRSRTTATILGWRADLWTPLFNIIGLCLVVLAVGRALQPIFFDLSKWGGHDWDQVTAQRFIVVKALLEYGQLPFWNPYSCGGHTAWGNVQGAPSLVSPLLPFYLLLDLRHAVRVEIVVTTLCGALGAWLWAGGVTRSPALRALVCLLFAVNGRWAMQVATGHDWHMYYALSPWTFYFFDRACGRPIGTEGVSRFWIVLCAACLALMVYATAIYPLPHTASLLVLYALLLALLLRQLLPLKVLALVGMTAIGLSAPKLLPMIANMARFPRFIDSTEYMSLQALVQALVAQGQDIGSRPAPIPQWGWHEYGMYIGWIPVLSLIMLIGASQQARERALRFAAIVAFVLGLGHFHEYAPWPLLHQLPVFSSHHVPTRWLYPALLLFGIVAAASGERGLECCGRHRRLAELALLALIAYVALDMSAQSFQPMRHAFWMEMPEIAVAPEFRQHRRVPRELQYRRLDYAPPALPAMFAGVGIIDCTLQPALNLWAPKRPNGRPSGMGAIGVDEAGYRGEAFLVSGVGDARITRFSPNEVRVSVKGAHPGDLLVLNQNWDPGWRVNDAAATDHEDRVAIRINQSEARFTFRYRPPFLILGLLLFAGTIAVLLLVKARRGGARGGSLGGAVGPVGDTEPDAAVF